MTKQNLTGPFVLLLSGALCWFWGYVSAGEPRSRAAHPDTRVERLEGEIAELQSMVEALELRSLQRSEAATRPDAVETDERADPEDPQTEVALQDFERTQIAPEPILPPLFDADRIVSRLNAGRNSRRVEGLMRAGLEAPIFTRFLRGELGPTEMQHRSRALRELLSHLETLHQTERGFAALDEFALSAGWSTTQIVVARFSMASELPSILQLGEQVLATADPDDRYNAYQKMVFALRHAREGSKATSLLRRGIQDLEAAGLPGYASHLRSLLD